MTNPLLDFSALPQFDTIQPEDVGPAIDDLLAKAEAALEQVTQPEFPARWSDISRVLDVATENLGRAWGAVSHLNGVADTPELRAAYNAALPRVTEFSARLGADERLYAKYKAIDVDSLDSEQRQAHKNAIRNFMLSGAELTGADKERFARIQELQAELSQKFSENALDATDAFAYYAPEGELAGVPADVLETALPARTTSPHPRTSALACGPSATGRGRCGAHRRRSRRPSEIATSRDRPYRPTSRRDRRFENSPPEAAVAPF